MRLVGITLMIVFLGLVVLSVSLFFFRIGVVQDFGGVPSIETVPHPMPAEAVPGSTPPAPVVTHMVVPSSRARVSFALLPMLLVALLAVGGTVLVVRLALGRGKSTLANVEEIRLIQEIHQGLCGLERRVESLETLLLDRAVIRDGEEWKRS